MAILVNAHQISKQFHSRPLFNKISFSVNSGERLGLIGPNGAGKSTLLKILAGATGVDEGVISVSKGLRIGYLEQVPSFQKNATVLSTILEGSQDPHDWENIAKASMLCSKFELSNTNGCGEEAIIENLSGGWKKRVALAREFMREPDLLLLDEPTNHLDVESIIWLEDKITTSPFASITITHDRVFLQKVSNRILELDRRNKDGLLSINGDYAAYLEAKSILMSGQEAQETRLRNTLRREMEWLRRGAKARTTKQQARIERAGDLQENVEELAYRNQKQELRLQFQGVEKNPKKLIEAIGISKSYQEKKIIPKVDILLTPKTRLALLGVNGCGKSTLIRLLLKTETPDTGVVNHADLLKIAYFEQHRDSLDPELTLVKAICPVGEYVSFQGARVHVRGYLDRFLFRPEQFEMPVKNLSGGEQSRILVAKLMLQEANVLVLDEPTNDLDLQTLDVLAKVLEDFQGTVLLVTHDRFFLDQVATEILAFSREENGNRELQKFIGLSQWEMWQVEKKSFSSKQSAKVVASLSKEGRKKLSYKDQREFDSMESTILEKETALELKIKESESIEVATNAAKLTTLSSEIANLQSEIERLYARWAELEALKGS